MKISFSVALLLALVAGEVAYAQPVQFRVPLSMQLVSGSRSDMVYVGVSGDGPGGAITDNTYLADDSTVFGPYGLYRETAAPPPPPTVILRTTFRDIPGRTGLSTGLRPYDFRGFASTAQTDTFAFRVEGDSVADNGVIISWPLNLQQYGNAWTIQPRTGTGFPVTNMLTSTTLTLAPTGGPFNILVIKAGVVTGVEQIDNVVPDAFVLAQNYPNPFNPSTEIRFSLAQSGRVSLIVYNTLGQEVAMLANEVKTAGTYGVQFNAANLSSGVYLYRLQTANFSDVKKLVLLK